jgi:hypothetical protein
MPSASFNLDVTSFLLGFTSALFILSILRTNQQQHDQATTTQPSPVPQSAGKRLSEIRSENYDNYETCHYCHRAPNCDQSREINLLHCDYHHLDHCVNNETPSDKEECWKLALNSNQPGTMRAFADEDLGGEMLIGKSTRGYILLVNGIFVL